MDKLVKDCMTTDLITVSPDTPLWEAAKCMRDGDVGDVLVVDAETLKGIVTDRDITIRAVADKCDLDLPVSEFCSTDLTTLSPEQPLDEAVKLMSDQAIRRIPVCDGSTPVGILALGDLAEVYDPSSVLAGISSAASSSATP